MPDSPQLVTGATGYVGGRLVERLLATGGEVRALARDPARMPERRGVEVVRGDLLTGAGLERALDGCSTAYYLVHSMEEGEEEDFASREARAAERFGSAAQRAGVERIVYLGGLLPAERPPSRHLASRVRVEELLLGSVPGSTALRASLLIGAGSPSFQILVRLVERLRLLPLPGWSPNRTSPIDERDAVEYLALTAERPEAAGRSLDIAGPDVLTYREMIERIAELMGVGRTSLAIRASQTPAASAIVAAVCEQPLELVRPLMESLEHELLPRDREAEAIYGIPLRRFDRAVDWALGQWEARQELAAR